MANAVPRPRRLCPKGHHMDPNWETCPYCESEQRANQRSRSPEVVVASERHRTDIRDVPMRGERRVTSFMAPAAERHGGGHVGEGDTRRIVGALITYTWRPEGQLFPVREGKNFIGSGDISSEAFHRPCDVQIAEDRRMSGEHALILCRERTYEIIDQASSNGTHLNDRMLRANASTEIPNYAKIRTGSTEWTFIHIEAPLETERPARVEPLPPPAPRAEPRIEAPPERERPAREEPPPRPDPGLGDRTRVE
jgi:pSer/pThr/pTyr-binding forkhead associated (FHA) protein